MPDPNHYKNTSKQKAKKIAKEKEACQNHATNPPLNLTQTVTKTQENQKLKSRKRKRDICLLLNYILKIYFYLGLNKTKYEQEPIKET